MSVDATPCVHEFETPNNTPKSKASHKLSFSSEDVDSSDLDEDIVSDTADNILRKIRVKNVNRIIIGTLNINSLAPKFEQLKEVIGNNIDILTIQETKLDSSFPVSQFLIDGYSEPYRLDRNRNGG